MSSVGVKAVLFNCTCMEFPARLRELRERRGWSQGELGLKIGVTWQTISRWELGKNQPKFEEFVKLANAFGVTLDELADRTEVPITDPVAARLASVEDGQRLQEKALADLAAAFLELAREQKRTNELLVEIRDRGSRRRPRRGGDTRRGLEQEAG